jgi:transposase
MSKSDLKARPIFHFTKDALRAHMLVCFMALMMGKYLEIKMSRLLRKIQDEIWRVHEIHLCYERTGEVYVKQAGRR